MKYLLMGVMLLMLACIGVLATGLGLHIIPIKLGCLGLGLCVGLGLVCATYLTRIEDV